LSPTSFSRASRGQNFPEEKHSFGISRKAAGKEFRLSYRFTIPPGGMVAIGICGPNPIFQRVFRAVSLHIRTDSVAAMDNDVMHPKGSPEAAALKKKGVWNGKMFRAKAAGVAIAPGVWHDLAV
jgi:hypothetical protein